MSTEDVHLQALLQRLDRQDRDLHAFGRELTAVASNLTSLTKDVAALASSIEPYQNEMRGTVADLSTHFTGVTDRTESKVDATCDLVNIAVQSKSRTEKVLDKVVLALTTCIVTMITYFGAPYLASKEDFWDTFWIAFKSALKAKAGA